MEGDSVISPEVVARYAADAVVEIDGVTRIVQGARRGIRIDGDTVELHVALRFGVALDAVGVAIQESVASYLEQMTDARPSAVNVVVDEIDVVA
jgi:uncharacterized alkaline shock family protein YloU